MYMCYLLKRIKLLLKIVLLNSPLLVIHSNLCFPNKIFNKSPSQRLLSKMRTTSITLFVFVTVIATVQARSLMSTFFHLPASWAADNSEDKADSTLAPLQEENRLAIETIEIIPSPATQPDPVIPASYQHEFIIGSNFTFDSESMEGDDYQNEQIDVEMEPPVTSSTPEEPKLIYQRMPPTTTAFIYVREFLRGVLESMEYVSKLIG